MCRKHIIILLIFWWYNGIEIAMSLIWHTIVVYFVENWLIPLCPLSCHWWHHHYSDVIMSVMASQTTGVSIVYSAVYSGTDQRKHQSSASLAFVRGIHRWHEFPTQRASNVENVPIWWRQLEVVITTSSSTSDEKSSWELLVFSDCNMGHTE